MGSAKAGAAGGGVLAPPPRRGSGGRGAAAAELLPLPPRSDWSAIAPRPTPHSWKNQRRAGEFGFGISDLGFEEVISFQCSVSLCSGRFDNSLTRKRRKGVHQNR